MTNLHEIEQAEYTAPLQISDAALQAALLSMANDNIGSDVQGLLMHGFDKLNAKPNALRNALIAALPHLFVHCAVEVKKLEWQEPKKGTNGCWTARSPIGTYSVVNENGWYAVLDGHAWGVDGFEWSSTDLSKDTRQTAFDAAQADFERRTLANIITKPVNVPEQLKEILSGERDGFINTGKEPHGNDADLSCPCCGGSGHKDDAKPVDVAAVQTDLDARLKAAGMYTVEEIMAGTPVDKWRVHAGMDNLQFFGEWLERKAREYKVMTAGYDIGDKDKSDELYEWSLAHSGAFHDVLVNFRAATRALTAPTTEAGK